MSEKQSIARPIKEREKAAKKVLFPQWKRCFWTPPFGHISADGSGCLYCGKPKFVLYNAFSLESYVLKAARAPIARNVPKDEVAA